MPGSAGFVDIALARVGWGVPNRTTIYLSGGHEVEVEE
jgi:hypothetical protein